MKCIQCKEKEARTKYCSKLCSSRFLQNKHRDKIRAKARQRLIDNPLEERKRRAEAAKKWRAAHPETSRKYHRVANGTALESDPNNIIFYGYKPPFQKLEGGFGYRGVLMYSKKDQKVQCHFCGLFFRALNSGHLKKVHNLTALEYKQKVGLSRSSALMGEETRQKLLTRGHNPNHMRELKKAWKKRADRKKKGQPDLQAGHTFKSLEKRNLEGSCPEQLLDRIKDAAKKLGRSPTLEEFLKLNEGKYWGAIRHTYGSWTDALKKLGMETHHKEYTRESLLESMRDFHKVHKRTPKWSDMNRGILPSTTAYYNHFKSLNDARLSAGVPLVIAYGKSRQEWTPTAEQREKMLAGGV